MKENVYRKPKRTKRCVKKTSIFRIRPIGETRHEQKQYIVDFSIDLYDYIRTWLGKDEVSETMTTAFATFIGCNFIIEGFSCEEVKETIYRAADNLRKNRKKGK